jgi:hypothetical protein
MLKRYQVLVLVPALLLAGAAGAAAQEKTAMSPNDAATVAALEKAMNPGEGQKKLEFMVGTFDVKIRTWVDPSKPPIESTATSVATWVLGNRYVQQMLSGHVGGEPWNGIGYAGFDNISKTYVATYMDSGSTGMDWFTGTMDADGKAAKMTATIHDAITLKPVKAELRLGIAANGDHTTSLWQAGAGGKMVKVMELQYTRKKS